MQPYLFPYLGYFQLLHAADHFLIYDDVTFIKQGYINRNKIASAGVISRFTIPVEGASSNRLITTLEFSKNVTKFLKQVSQSYARAPYRGEIMNLLEVVMTSEERAISDLCKSSYKTIFNYLGLSVSLTKTSDLDYDRDGTAKDRLIELCLKLKAEQYINLPGGRKLYSKKDFSVHNIDLKFINMKSVHYNQQYGFIPNLSIIDVLMNCSPETVVTLLKQYTLD